MASIATSVTLLYFPAVTPRLLAFAGRLCRRRYNYQRCHGATKCFSHGVQDSLAYSDQQCFAPADTQQERDDKYYSLLVWLELCNTDDHEQLSFCYLFELRIVADCYRQRSLCASLEHAQVEGYTFTEYLSLRDCFVDPIIHPNEFVDSLAYRNRHEIALVL